MSKSIFYRLFRAGAIPKNVRARLAQEAVLLQEEGVCGSLTFRDFRAPGRVHRLKVQRFAGSLVLTRQHLLAFAWSMPVIGLSWQDAKIRALNGTVESGNTLCLSYDAALFNRDWSGIIEVRYRTSMAAAVLENLRRYAGAEKSGQPKPSS